MFQAGREEGETEARLLRPAETALPAALIFPRLDLSAFVTDSVGGGVANGGTSLGGEGAGDTVV